MSDLTFNCPHCNQLLKISEEMSEKIVECPYCNRQIQLPAPEPKKISPRPVPVPKKKQYPDLGQQLVQGIIFLLIIIGTTIGAVGFGCQRPLLIVIGATIGIVGIFYWTRKRPKHAQLSSPSVSSQEKPHDNVTMKPTKDCPFCGEKILTAATKCKHCGSSIGVSATLGQVGKGLSNLGCVLTFLLTMPILLILFFFFGGC